MLQGTLALTLINHSSLERNRINSTQQSPFRVAYNHSSRQEMFHFSRNPNENVYSLSTTDEFKINLTLYSRHRQRTVCVMIFNGTLSELKYSNYDLIKKLNF
jgi:hypothetical protein